MDNLKVKEMNFDEDILCHFCMQCLMKNMRSFFSANVVPENTGGTCLQMKWNETKGWQWPIRVQI